MLPGELTAKLMNKFRSDNGIPVNNAKDLNTNFLQSQLTKIAGLRTGRILLRAYNKKVA
jgi:hypothetical protein